MEETLFLGSRLFQPPTNFSGERISWKDFWVRVIWNATKEFQLHLLCYTLFILPMNIY